MDISKDALLQYRSFLTDGERKNSDGELRRGMENLLRKTSVLHTENLAGVAVLTYKSWFLGVRDNVIQLVVRVMPGDVTVDLREVMK